MGDPRIPISAMSEAVVTLWLGTVCPMLNGVVASLHQWQTLVGAFVALIAACVAFRNTTRSLRQAEKLEKTRRSRKHASLRAVLPLALAEVSDYAEQSAHSLNGLVSQCEGETLPANIAQESLIQPLPSETLKALAEFIEYSDPVDVRIIEATIASIQIHDSRLRDIVTRNRDPSRSGLVNRMELEERIIDAASIGAGADAVYEYARRQMEQLPITISWDAVRSALRNMRFWDEEYPWLGAVLTRRENASTGPFERPIVKAP
jgi:hypothetical protein